MATSEPAREQPPRQSARKDATRAPPVPTWTVRIPASDHESAGGSVWPGKEAHVFHGQSISTPRNFSTFFFPGGGGCGGGGGGGASQLHKYGGLLLGSLAL